MLVGYMRVSSDSDRQTYVRNEDVARLSPLGHEHINMLGRYAFTLPEPVARGELRPLRSPATLSDDA
jgi:hypothetical protein